MKATDEEVLAAVDSEICPEQTDKLRIIRLHMDSLEMCRANLEPQILSLAVKYTDQIKLVSSVPGIKSFSAISIIAEIGVNMSVFQTSKHLCSWSGLTPQKNESARKKKAILILQRQGSCSPKLRVLNFNLF